MKTPAARTSRVPDPAVVAEARRLAEPVTDLVAAGARRLADVCGVSPEVAAAALTEQLLTELRADLLPRLILAAGDAAAPARGRSAAYEDIGRLTGLSRTGVLSRLRPPGAQAGHQASKPKSEQ